MSYHKEFIADGGCPTQGARFKVISVHLNDFEVEPIYTKTINCNSCPKFFQCVFKHEPCVVYKCVKSKFNWIPMRNIGSELRFVAPDRFADTLIRVVEYGIRVAQNTK